jgi:hypothetical protein
MTVEKAQPMPHRLPARFVRLLSLTIALAVSLPLSPAAIAAPVHKPAVHKKRHIGRHWHGYGFLPGYRPPEVIARERAEHYWASGPHYYGPAWPRFYRGRWNGGGFGPCYVETPIGYMWTCGK